MARSQAHCETHKSSECSRSSDAAVESGIAVAHRTKVRGDNRLIGSRVHIDDGLAPRVGSSSWGWRGPRSRLFARLKRYASWVQNVVRQFGHITVGAADRGFVP